MTPATTVAMMETEGFLASSPESDLNNTDKITGSDQVEGKVNPNPIDDVAYWEDEDSKADDGCSYDLHTKSLWY